MDFSNEETQLQILSHMLTICAGCIGPLWSFEGKLAYLKKTAEMPSFSSWRV